MTEAFLTYDSESRSRILGPKHVSAAARESGGGSAGDLPPLLAPQAEQPVVQLPAVRVKVFYRGPAPKVEMHS